MISNPGCVTGLCSWLGLEQYVCCMDLDSFPFELALLAFYLSHDCWASLEFCCPFRPSQRLYSPEGAWDSHGQAVRLLPATESSTSAPGPNGFDPQLDSGSCCDGCRVDLQSADLSAQGSLSFFSVCRHFSAVLPQRKGRTSIH